MAGLVRRSFRTKLRRPQYWSWVRDFTNQPETQRLLTGGAPNRLNPEDIARRRCIDALVCYRKASRAGESEVAWQHFDLAEAIYRQLPACRTNLRLALEEVWEALLRMSGPRRRRLLENPYFDEICRLVDDLSADKISASFQSTEKSRIASKPRGKRKSKKPDLWERGLRAVLGHEGIEIKPEELKDRIDAEGGALTYDKPGDEGVELSVDRLGGVRVKELRTGATTTITKQRLRTYLGRARDRLRKNKGRNQ